MKFDSIKKVFAPSRKLWLKRPVYLGEYIKVSPVVVEYEQAKAQDAVKEDPDELLKQIKTENSIDEKQIFEEVKERLAKKLLEDKPVKYNKDITLPKPVRKRRVVKDRSGITANVSSETFVDKKNSEEDKKAIKDVIG